MSPIGFSPSSFKEDRWYGICGAVRTRRCFLALPAIFCASAKLLEKHEIRRKREAGLDGWRRGEEAAALDSAGAALGALGTLAFAIVFSVMVKHSIPRRLHRRFARLVGGLGGGLVPVGPEEAKPGRSQRPAPGAAKEREAADDAFALTPLRSATVFSLALAAFSSLRLVVRKRTISS
jgi:hypothetical protein